MVLLTFLMHFIVCFLLLENWLVQPWFCNPNRKSNSRTKIKSSILWNVSNYQNSSDLPLLRLWCVHWLLRSPLSLGWQMHRKKKFMFFLFFLDNDIRDFSNVHYWSGGSITTKQPWCQTMIFVQYFNKIDGIFW